MPSLTQQQFARYIQTANLKELFIDMGWNNDSARYIVSVAQHDYALQAIAQKEGFKIVVCQLARIPEYPVRRAIAQQLTPQAFHHLLIFVDSNNNQRWMIQQRHADKPYRIIEIPWYAGQTVEALYQRARGLFFNLDEEGKITIVDVIERVTGQLSANSERVTKRFYDRFKREHSVFKSAIRNIDKEHDVDWYASLMLNRLMFCYFIQKKRFLNDDPNYLAKKLSESADKRGHDQFYSFYRNFLLVLFHDGLGGRQSREQVQAELGRIPYLNGGLFDVHQIEREYPDIVIGDEAFGQIFAFFDEYEWHLDTSPEASGREINPDVIGYIFEKYINDRAKMGAYYTKEDITEYISKNSIIPFIFDATARQAGANIWDDAWAWLQQSGDTYIYPAVKHGCHLALPAEIAVGITDVVARSEWNKAAPAEYANPTEIWREVVARRQRYTELCHTITNGDIRQINDLITYNLDIRQFCQDVLARSTNPTLIKAVYDVLTSMTVLDPTCGSGAFLFAALNILEPLYGECLNRMEVFVDEEVHTQDIFGTILAQMRDDSHANPQYFIYKSIILNNLYGVDIMKEATEVAKLRLFLKLVASVDADRRKPNLGIEPLPDIDFNIRAGNALVGFATKQALDDALASTMDGILMRDQINELSAKVAQDFAEYKELQLSSSKYELLGRTKAGLKKSLADINTQLNALLHQAQSGTPYDTWLESHKPFHWFAEFYEIIVGKGGFDVIIGNPPYVEYAPKKIGYVLANLKTMSCGNLYAYIIERVFDIKASQSAISMIIPHSSICTDRMISLQPYILREQTWVSTFDTRPGKLFQGVDQRLCIFINRYDSQHSVSAIYTTNYLRWAEESRISLFENLHYVKNTYHYISNSITKFNHNIEINILNKVMQMKPYVFQINSTYNVYYHNAPRYWIRGMNIIPHFYSDRDGHKMSGHVKRLDFIKLEDAQIFSGIMNSSLFYWWFIITSNCRDLVRREIDNFPINLNNLNSDAKNQLISLSQKLMDDFEEHKFRKVTMYQSTGRVEYDEYYPKLSKHIIDEIDRVLAQHYGFTDEELDYIINYDIKYRMGRAGAEGNDDDAGDEE
jgi:Eco57I restriction-modification methylase